MVEKKQIGAMNIFIFGFIHNTMGMLDYARSMVFFYALRKFYANY